MNIFIKQALGSSRLGIRKEMQDSGNKNQDSVDIMIIFIKPETLNVEARKTKQKTIN